MTEIKPPRFTYYKSKDGRMIYVLDEGMLFITAVLTDNDKIRVEASTDNEMLETGSILENAERMTDEELIIMLQSEQWQKIGQILGGAVEALKERLESVIRMNQEISDSSPPIDIESPQSILESQAQEKFRQFQKKYSVKSESKDEFS